MCRFFNCRHFTYYHCWCRGLISANPNSCVYCLLYWYWTISLLQEPATSNSSGNYSCSSSYHSCCVYHHHHHEKTNWYRHETTVIFILIAYYAYSCTNIQGEISCGRGSPANIVSIDTQQTDTTVGLHRTRWEHCVISTSHSILS